MPPAGFVPEIPASERPQTHALDLAAAGIGAACFGLPLIVNQIVPMLDAAKEACPDDLLAVPCVGVVWVSDRLGCFVVAVGHDGSVTECSWYRGFILHTRHRAQCSYVTLLIRFYNHVIRILMTKVVPFT
jgi:hypothetical protein